MVTAIQILDPVVEGSNWSIPIDFTDWQSGDGVTPDTVTWTLQRAGGAVINNRLNVSETPGESISIDLEPEDTVTLGLPTGGVEMLELIIDVTNANDEQSHNVFYLPVMAIQRGA